jgi:hypothetical protein
MRVRAMASASMRQMRDSQGHSAFMDHNRTLRTQLAPAAGTPQGQPTRKQVETSQLVGRAAD